MMLPLVSHQYYRYRGIIIADIILCININAQDGYQYQSNLIATDPEQESRVTVQDQDPPTYSSIAPNANQNYRHLNPQTNGISLAIQQPDGLTLSTPQPYSLTQDCPCFFTIVFFYCCRGRCCVQQPLVQTHDIEAILTAEATTVVISNRVQMV